jgi:hypothetical protein
MANFFFKDPTAKKVLDIVKRLLKTKPKSWNGKGHIEMYSNGREQGFCIKVWCNTKVMSIAFATYRSSDQIVVYSGNESFSLQGNSPSDDAYHSKALFPPVAHEEAAKHIISLLEQFIDNA